MRKRSARPRLSLTDRLANLHSLLRSGSFQRWPLKVTFYADDVFRVWQKWTAHESLSLPDRLEVRCNEPSRPPSTTVGGESDGGAGIYTLDVGYKALKPQLEKSKAVLSAAHPCAFCSQPLSADGSSSLVCSQDGCHTAGHLRCFASAFLKDDGQALIPIAGGCPGCGTRLQWVGLVQELSLRMRAPKDVEKILNPKKARNGKQATDTLMADGKQLAEDDDEDMEIDAPLKDDWHYLSDESADDLDERLLQDPSPVSKSSYSRGFVMTSRPAALIEDSEWDEAEAVV